MLLERKKRFLCSFVYFILLQEKKNTIWHKHCQIIQERELHFCLTI